MEKESLNLIKKTGLNLVEPVIPKVTAQDELIFSVLSIMSTEILTAM